MKNFSTYLRFVALTTILTLGVGQIQAGQGYNGESHVYLNVDGTTKYYKVSTESWSTGASLPGTWGGVLKDQTFSNIHTLEIKGGAVGGWTENGGSLSGTMYYKITANSTTPSSGWMSFGSISTSTTNKNGNNLFYYKNNGSTNVTPHEAGTYYLHIKITDGDSNNRTSYVKFTIPSYTVAGSSAVLGTDWGQTDTNNDMVWSSGTTYTLTKSNVSLTQGTTYEYKVVYNHDWTTSYPGSNASINFGNTTGHYDVTFTFNASTHAVSATATRLYAVTYKGNSNTSGSEPATTYHANGATVTVASNSGSLARTGYTFGGWNTNSGGTGTNYTAGSGTFTMGSSDKDLYAKWTENKSTVTLVASPSGKGTFTVGGSTVTSTQAGVATKPEVTAVPTSGYHFVSWSITGGATISSTSANPTTVTGKGAGAAATLTATFEADAVNSLTVTAGTHVTTVTGSVSPVTLGNSYAINATAFESGYQFLNWTASPAANGTFANANSASTNVTVNNGSVTVTANAQEKMTTVTVNVSPTGAGTLTVDGNAFTPGNTTTAGVSTSRTVVATAGNDYTFGSWSVTGNATGTNSTNTYTLKGNGSAGTGTLTANFTAKTKVRLYYSNPDGWTAVKAYVWASSNTGDKNAEWSGEVITSNTLVRNGDTYYYYEYYKEDHPNWDRIIFNNGSSQTGDITFSNTTNNNQYNDATSGQIGSWYDLPAQETTYAVTFNAGANGSVSVRGNDIAANGSQSVQIGTIPRTLTATPASGYNFAGWTTTGSVTIADASSASTTVTATGTGTVTATWIAPSGWYAIGEPYGGWNSTTTPIDNPYRGISGIYYRPVNVTSTNQYYKVKKNDTQYGQNSGDDVVATKKTIYSLTATSEEKTAFKTNNEGSVWYVVDDHADTKKFWIQDAQTYYNVNVTGNDNDKGPTKVTLKTTSAFTKGDNVFETTKFANGETFTVTVTGVSGWIPTITIGSTTTTFQNEADSYSADGTMGTADVAVTISYTAYKTLTYYGNGNTGGTVPAAASYVSGTSVIVAGQGNLVMTRYTFAGWNTTQYITGTDYAAGSSITMNSNKTLYAKWTRDVTLNQNGATTNSSPTSFTGIYNCTTLPSITNPQKTGYDFGGWCTEIDSGNVVINNGAFQPSKTNWTDSSGRFKRATGSEDKPLYAKWTQTITLDANTANHGSGGNGVAYVRYQKKFLYNGTRHCTPASGYKLKGYYTAATNGTKVLNADGTFAASNVTGYITSDRWTKDGATTLYAQYEEDLSSPYTLKGGTNITGDDWATAHNFTKKTGHSAESVAYCTFAISSTNAGVNGDASGAWSFKVIEDGSTWYGLSAGGDSYWWLRSTSANQELSTSGKNIQLCADVAGEYEIKIDYSTPSSPKVTVIYPTGVSLAASKSQYVRGQSITFTATPYGGTSPTYQYRYKKDDGAYNSYSGSGTSFSFTPTETGTYTVEVKMTSGGTDYLATTIVTIVDASIPCSWTEPDWSNDTKMTWDGTNSRFYYSRSFDSDSWHEFKITNGMWCNNDDNCEVWDCHNKNTSTSQNVTYDCTDNNNVKFQPAATGIATIYFDPSTNDIWIIGCSTPSITSVRTTYDILANASTQVGPTSVTNANTYSWEIISGTGGSFASGSSVTTSTVLNPTFYPQSGVNRTYVLRLTVSNDCGQSKTQDYTVYAWQTMPKVTLNVTNSSGDSNWGTSTIYAYWYKDGSHNGFVPLTYSAGTWTGDIPKNTAELGYKIYICKEQNTSSAVRTYDSNEYGYVEIPAGNAYYKTYNLDIIPTKGTQQQFGLTERCESFTLQNSTFTLGNQSNISIAVSKKSDSPHNIPEGATYLWSCIQGLNGDDLLSSNTDAAPTFYKTRNGQTATGRYVFQVTVTNPRNTDCFAVALITIDCWAEKYYLKHAKSANNTNWGWDEMTYQGDGMYTCSAYYDGDDSNVGAKVSIDKKIRVNAKVYDQDLCSEQSWGATTLHYWDPNNLSDNHDVTSYEKSAYDGYQFIIPEGQSFTLWDEYFDSGNSNTNSHHTVDWVGPVNDDVYFLIKASSAANCYTSYAIYESWASGHSGAEYPDGYVRYDGYRTKDNILGHEHAAGTVLWVYNAATDELSISESGTYYRLASTVPAKSSTNFAGTAGKTYYSNGIKSTDIGNTAAALVSMYVAGGADVRLQESTNGGVTYSDLSSPAVGYAGPAADGVWNAHLSSTNNGATLDWSRYTGDYYLRSKGLLNNTANYKTANAKFVKFEPDRSNINEFYNNYWAGHLVKGENISAMVANDLNPCLSDELGSYYVGLGNYAPNIRYAYDTLTNHFSYSLLNGSTAGLEFLTVFGGLNVYDKAGSDKQLLTQANAEELSDQSNWVYVAEIYANANATVRLLGKYQKEYGGTPILNWLLGNGDNLVTLPVLTTNSPDDIRHLLVSYDFKTNKIVVGWIPEGDNINANITLEGNLILRRENNQNVKTFSLATNKTITGLERAYFNFILKPATYTYTDDNGVSQTYNNPNTDGLTAEHNIYWFSLPFDCEVKDIFGIAGYGTDWVIQRYRGDARAHYSWTSNISTFWRNVPLTYTLKAGEGYALVFTDRIKFSAITVNNVITVQNSIFFPSKDLIGNVTDQAATATYPENICTAQNGLRKAEDSNWQVIGPITYEGTVRFSSYTPSSADQPSATAGKTYPNFLYVFDDPFQKSQGNNNPISAYQVKDGSDFEYRTTYSYMTQYAGTITWQSAASSVTSNAPRRRVNGQNEQVQGTNHRESYEIQLITNTDTLDHTYVVLATGSDADFMPGEDLYKFSEGGKSVVYTEASEKPAAGNALPYQSQEVPVTVNLAESGDYTFALDGDIDGTTGVQLVDNADGVTTDLRQYSYSATLPAGETRGRFTLIFTIDAGQHGGQTTGLTDLYENTLVRVIDGRIVVDGMPAGATLRLYDATGKLIYGAKSQEQGTKNSWQSAPLPQGVYMLRIGNHTTKVVL